MSKNENVVIDNETQAIYVDGKKWEPSPTTYGFLGIFRRDKPVEIDPIASTAYLDHCLAQARAQREARRG